LSVSEARRTRLAKVHIAKKELGLTAGYEDVLRGLTGERSAADLTDHELDHLIEHFEDLGWQARPPREARAAADPQSRMIRALWLRLHRLGIVEHPERSAMEHYVERMSRGRPLARLSTREKSAVIESLKAWLARETEPAG